MTLKEFETVAYALKPGEVSRPLKSPVGVHIIKMLERKQLEPYDTLKPQIVAGLKRQGYEEASAENRIGKIVAASHGRLTREAVLDSVLEANIKNNEDLRYLVQEYHDGLLLYEISKKNVWDKVANDKEQLKALFKKNKKKYAWSEPRFRGFVYHMKEEGLGRQVKKVLKKNAEGDWRAALKREINKDSIIVRVSGPYLCKKGENSYIDQLEFDGPAAKPMTGFPYFGVYGKVLKRPKDYTDVKSQVESYYQELLEKEWVDRLHTQFPFEVNRSLLETIK